MSPTELERLADAYRQADRRIDHHFRELIASAWKIERPEVPVIPIDVWFGS